MVSSPTFRQRRRKLEKLTASWFPHSACLEPDPQLNPSKSVVSGRTFQRHVVMTRGHADTETTARALRSPELCALREHPHAPFLPAAVPRLLSELLILFPDLRSGPSTEESQVSDEP